VAVPPLTLPIQYGRVRLSDGGEPVADFVRRLKGVGYGGCVAVDDPPGVPEDGLADAVVMLRAWGAPLAGGTGGKAAGSGTVKH
jgi:hypothetical protein